MHRVENKTAPSMFLTKFCKLSHRYPINFSAHNFLVPTLKLKKIKYRVSIRGLLLWNNIFTAAEKTQESLPKFRNIIKENFLSMINEINYFWIGNIKAENQFLSELNYSTQLFCTHDKGTWWQDLNGLLQAPSRYLRFIWKRFLFLFPSPTQYYFMRVFIFYIVLGCYITVTM